jgi:hypothetical protein
VLSISLFSGFGQVASLHACDTDVDEQPPPLRVLVCVPAPHVAEQAPHDDQEPHVTRDWTFDTGQFAALHCCDSDVEEQPPPLRVLVCVPPPHVLEQSPHDVQSPHVGQFASLHCCDSDVEEQPPPLRVLLCVPPPHVLEQSPHDVQDPHVATDEPVDAGHLSSLHIWPSDNGLQSAPTRDLVCQPPPHVSEQAPHADQEPQLVSPPTSQPQAARPKGDDKYMEATCTPMAPQTALAKAFMLVPTD